MENTDNEYWSEPTAVVVGLTPENQINKKSVLFIQTEVSTSLHQKV